MDAEGRCIERQVWINNGDKRARWDVAMGVNALQTFGAREYGFYINEEGPHWVQKETLTKLKRKK